MKYNVYKVAGNEYNGAISPVWQRRTVNETPDGIREYRNAMFAAGYFVRAYRAVLDADKERREMSGESVTITGIEIAIL